MSFPKKVEDAVLVKCQRSCCICHKFCGLKMELHHIKQSALGGPDSEENCIPLCFDCHAEVKAYNPQHPKGHSYSEQELILHRDNWYKKVASSGAYCSNESYIEVDRQTYSSIRLLFNEDIQYFLSKFDFSNDYFSDKQLDLLYKFKYFCENPEHEFLDSDLEILKSDLNIAVCNFLHHLSVNTFKCGMDLFNVPNEWAEEQPERFEKVVKLLNETASEVWGKYCTFVKTSRRKLAI